MGINIANSSRKKRFSFDQLHDMGMARHWGLRHGRQTFQKSLTVWKRTKSKFANDIGMNQRFKPFAKHGKVAV